MVTTPSARVPNQYTRDGAIGSGDQGFAVVGLAEARARDCYGIDCDCGGLRIGYGDVSSPAFGENDVARRHLN
jgi:hypothetical protein